jgi:hypothetical protein
MKANGGKKFGQTIIISESNLSCSQLEEVIKNNVRPRTNARGLFHKVVQEQTIVLNGINYCFRGKRLANCKAEVLQRIIIKY